MGPLTKMSSTKYVHSNNRKECWAKGKQTYCKMNTFYKAKLKDTKLRGVWKAKSDTGGIHKYAAVLFAAFLNHLSNVRRFLFLIDLQIFYVFFTKICNSNRTGQSRNESTINLKKRKRRTEAKWNISMGREKACAHKIKRL